MNITLSTHLDNLFNEASYNVSQHIEMLYAQAKSFVSEDSAKQINEKILDTYFKKRGYVENTVLGKRIWCKDFVCAYITKEYIEVWHDVRTRKQHKSVFINESMLTGLPITLKYMEKI